jgi:hypothetical protein
MTRFALGFALTLAAATALSAPETSLDGPWQLCRTATDARPGGDAEWTDITVPSFVSQARGKPFLWYRRSFRVPEASAKLPHLFLRFGGAKFVTTVFVNGREAGGHTGGFEPFEVEVTKLIRRKGKNDLLVRVQDVTGVIDQRMEYGKTPRGARFIDQAEGAILHPVGSQYRRVGLWQPVALIARPEVYIEDVWVRTSVREKQIEAGITVRNMGDQPRTVSLSVSAQPHGVADAWTELSMDPATLAVPAGAAKTITLEKRWEKPTLWTPEKPHLYNLIVQINANGNALDASVTRFGFREFWIDGTKFVLNGTPMTFLATAGHPRGTLDGKLSKEGAKDFYGRIREAGCVAMRLHANVWPEAWYEAADEVGMPLIMESALFCYARSYALNKPVFWKNYRDHLAAIIRHKRNHPAIVMTSLENEILHCGGNRYAEDCEHRLAEAGRFVKQLDPTRPIMYDGDADPEGVADVINLHYPLDFDEQNLWPNCAWWLDEGMKVAGWPRTFWKWDRKKPLYFGEFLHLQHYREADNYTTLLGDAAYRGHDWAMAHCKARAWEMQIKAYRAQGVSGMCPWTLTETGEFPSEDNPRYLAVKRAYQPIAAFIREKDTQFYAGQGFRRTVDIYNDTLHPARVTLVWELGDGGGGPAIQAGQRVFDLQPAQHVPFTIRFRGVELMEERRLRLTLSLGLRRDGKTIYERCYDYRFYKRSRSIRETLEPIVLRVALYDGPKVELAPTLRDAGVLVETVRDLRKLPDVPVLIIGPHALDGLAPEESVPTVGPSGTARDALSAFVRSGGRIIALEQDSYPSGLLPARLVDRGCTIAFPRAYVGIFPEHTIYDSDCRFWGADHVVARRTLAKPSHGRFIALADSGGPDGLVYLPALEVLAGKGSYVLSQFLVGEKLDTAPSARGVLNALLLHASRPTFPVEALAVVQRKLRLTDSLDEVEAVFTDISGKLAAADLAAFDDLLVESDAPEVAQNVGKLRRFVEQGGWLILHAGTRNGIARLAKLFPEPVIAQPNTSVPVHIAAFSTAAGTPSGLIEGLTNQELYWYGDRSGMHWRVETPLSAEVCDHVILGGLPDPETCQTVEAEQMAEVHGSPNLRDEAAYLWRRGAIKTTVEVPQDGEYAFIIRGRGTPVAGVYPQIAITLDGERLGSVTTAGEDWGEYFLTAAVARGKHEVTLAFVNDLYAPERDEDRNVSLDWLRVGPVPPMKAKRLLNPPALVKMPLGKGVILFDQVRWDKRPGDVKASRYLSCLLTNLNCDFRSPMAGVTLPADAFKPKEGVRLARVRGGVVYMGTRGTVAARVRFAKAGRYEFAVRAWGTQAAGEWPNLALSVAGKTLGDASLRRPGWHTVRIEAQVPQGEHEVGLSFTNDYYDDTQEPPADRNVRIRELRIRPGRGAKE